MCAQWARYFWRRTLSQSLEIRAQITNMRDPAEPFKIMGNLYFVGVANGEVYLLTSPQRLH